VAKIVVKKLNPVRLSKAAARGVGKKRVPTVDGGWKTVRTLDVYHPNFDDALLLCLPQQRRQGTA